MLADFEPRHSSDEHEPEAVDTLMPEILEVNFELDPETKSKLQKLGAVSIKPSLLPAA